MPLTVCSSPMPAPGLPIHLLVRLCQAARNLGGRGLTFGTLLATAFYSLVRLSLLLPSGTGTVDLSRVPLLADLVISPGRALIKIKWGKTSQATSDGFWVPIKPVAGTSACPVELLLALQRQLPHGPSFLLPCFRGGGGGGGGGGQTFFKHFTMREARTFAGLASGTAGTPTLALYLPLF